jgi:hypothetical protein
MGCGAVVVGAELGVDVPVPEDPLVGVGVAVGVVGVEAVVGAVLGAAA